MLVTFKTRAAGDLVYLGDIGKRLLRQMGMSGQVPGAIQPEEIPQALKKLEAALADEPEGEAPDSNDDGGKRVVSLRHRALPLIDLLKAAQKADVAVIWE